MTATDELRRMLNERGVEYETADTSTCKFTRWCKNGIDAGWDGDENWEQPHLLVIGFTPAQAIAATLGAGTCKPLPFPERHGEVGDYEEFWEPACKCSECGELIPMRNFCPNCGARIEVDE